MAGSLLLCKWGAAAPPCGQSMLRATAWLLSCHGRSESGIHGDLRAQPSATEETYHSLPPAWPRTTPLTNLFNSTVISPARWAENANGQSTKAMWHGLTWSLMPFSVTTPIWSSVVVRVGLIRMLPWIRSQCPRSPVSSLFFCLSKSGSLLIQLITKIKNATNWQILWTCLVIVWPAPCSRLCRIPDWTSQILPTALRSSRQLSVHCTRTRSPSSSLTLSCLWQSHRTFPWASTGSSRGSVYISCAPMLVCGTTLCPMCLLTLEPAPVGHMVHRHFTNAFLGLQIDCLANKENTTPGVQFDEEDRDVIAYICGYVIHRVLAKGSAYREGLAEVLGSRTVGVPLEWISSRPRWTPVPTQRLLRVHGGMRADAAWSDWPGASQWGLAVARSTQGGPTGEPDTLAALGVDWWVPRHTDAQGDPSVSHHQGPRIYTSGHEAVHNDSGKQTVYQRTSQIPAEQFPGFGVVGMTWTLYCSTPSTRTSCEWCGQGYW